MKNDYKKALEESAVIAFVPDGRSMWPFIKGKKYAVIITRKTEERLSLFDVAFFIRPDGNYVLHRVVEVLPDGYVMQGDSQEYVETVMEENVIGVMQGYYRGKRYVDATSNRYVIKVIRWYRKKRKRKFVLFFFNLQQRIKNKLKRIFKIGER